MGQVRGGSVAVAAAVLGLVLSGCGQREKPADVGPPKGPEGVSATGSAPYDSPEDVPERLAEDGTTIVVGDPDAVVTVHLYEDPRCPYCEEFETTGGGPGLRDATVTGQAAAEYTLASFLDDKLGGSGSKKAVNALRAALEQGKFAEYHEVLYDNQPEEIVDGYTDAYLLELAGEVDGLRGPAFDDAVKTMKYRSFVTASEKAYEQAGGKEEPGGPGTPSADINEVRIPGDYKGLLYDAQMFSQLLNDIHERPWTWGDQIFE
ncbi:protein-disulfide isomerase [Streptomyces sp. SAI-170]|uniref:thioredoxin domain-containing protein n=1 Tax=Streptomyces sp. SAI-170 TaxID=3377729 RepID=UPI003C7D8355